MFILFWLFAYFDIKPTIFIKAAEIARAEALMSGEKTYIRSTHGEFEYMAVLERWYVGDRRIASTGMPFETGKQNLIMFAWNAETGDVRYITCDRDDPYYLSLAW